MKCKLKLSAPKVRKLFWERNAGMGTENTYDWDTLVE
jgi:hypothetical protein